MHYVYEAIVLAANISTNNTEVDVKLTAGIIKHVSILFPPGCARLVKCSIWNTAEQLLPSNPEAIYGEDAYAVEIDCYLPTWIYGNQFYILAWNIGTVYKHVVRVMFDVQDVDEPDMALAVQTLYKTVESLTKVLKGFY